MAARFRLAIALLIVLGALFAVGGYTLVTRLGDISQSTIRSNCDNRMLADYAIATARALAAPPAPNTERLAAVRDINRSARRLAHADAVCKGGVPAPLVPSPAT